MKDFESLTVISVEHYCKVVWFTCFKIINIEISKSNQKVITCNQLHYVNKVIEKLHYLLHFK